MSSGKVAEEKLLEEAGLKEVEKLLSSLTSETPKLVIKTKELFKGSSKEERLELLDKTQEYADSQAKLDTNISQVNHLEEGSGGRGMIHADTAASIMFAANMLNKVLIIDGFLQKRCDGINVPENNALLILTILSSN